MKIDVWVRLRENMWFEKKWSKNDFFTFLLFFNYLASSICNCSRWALCIRLTHTTRSKLREINLVTWIVDHLLFFIFCSTSELKSILEFIYQTRSACIWVSIILWFYKIVLGNLDLLPWSCVLTIICSSSDQKIKNKIMYFFT